MEIRNSHKAEVPRFDFENFSRKGFKEVQVSEESGVVKYKSFQIEYILLCFNWASFLFLQDTHFELSCWKYKVFISGELNPLSTL
jgi:hypothetical protein